MAKAAEKVTDPEEKLPKGGDGDEGDDAAEGSGGEKKSKKKIIIIGAGAAALLIAAVAGAYFMGYFKHEEKTIAEIGPDGKPLEKPVFYTLPEFLINLNSGGKQAMFLKATVIFEVPHQGDVPQIEANLPRLLDALNTYLRELRPSDLAGSAGIQRLREELLLRANKILAPVKINDVLFKEIIVQ